MILQEPGEVAASAQDAGSPGDPGIPPIEPAGLGRRAVRGVLITAAFVASLELLKAAAGLFTARLLQPRDYALFGAALASLNIVAQVVNLDLNSRLVQAETDDRRLYDLAFTMQLGLAVLYAVLAAGLGQVVSRVYAEPALVPICLALSAQAISLPANVALVPLLRELAWWRQRLVASIGPLVGLAVTLGLAVSHAGVWALVWGQVASSLVMALVLWVYTPRRPHLTLKFSAATTKYFLSFSGPLWAAGVVGIVAGNGLLFEVKLALGLSALGFFRLAVSLGERIDTAESVVSAVIYPVICRLRDRDQMARAFDISGRVLLVWAVPAGIGLAVFAEDIQHFVLGPQWRAIVPLLQVEGLVEVANAVATMWALFYMATGDTRPSLWMGVQVNVLMVVCMGILGGRFGLAGIAAAIGIAALFALVQRRRFIQRLFPRIPVLRSALPLVAAGAGAGVVAVVLRLVVGPDTAGGLLLRLLAYALAYLALAAVSQRGLVRDVRALSRAEAL